MCRAGIVGNMAQAIPHLDSDCGPITGNSEVARKPVSSEFNSGPESFIERRDLVIAPYFIAVLPLDLTRTIRALQSGLSRCHSFDGTVLSHLRRARNSRHEDAVAGRHEGWCHRNGFADQVLTKSQEGVNNFV